MSELTIQLEAYSIPIRKQKIFCVGDLYSLDKSYNSLLQLFSEEVLRRNKIVVVFSDTFLKHQPKYLKNTYIDAIFRIRETQDLRLAYTYIQNCSKPLIVLWYGYDIPSPIFQSKDDITLISGGTYPKNEYSTIFWNTKSSHDEVVAILSSKMKDVDTKTILNETKASDVSLVWSSVGESDKRGSLYWFDFNSIKNYQPNINYAQASEYLRNLADVLESKAE
jgi:hypothetical protein